MVDVAQGHGMSRMARSAEHDFLHFMPLCQIDVPATFQNYPPVDVLL